MELVRIIVEGPQDGTVWVLISTPTSTAESLLTDGRFLGLVAAIQAQEPLEVVAEGANVYYRWSQATGIVSPLATSATGTAAQQGGVRFANSRAGQAEHLSRDTAFLLHTTGSGMTGILRITKA